MNIRSNILIAGAILFFIIVFSLSSSGGVVPYSSETLFPRYFPYEGFTGVGDNAELLSPSAVAGPSAPVLVSGFNGLQTTPNDQEKPLDHFSELKSGGSCGPSPYSNSQGYLCLDATAQNMLSTRGGNQSGAASQVGSPKGNM